MSAAQVPTNDLLENDLKSEVENLLFDWDQEKAYDLVARAASIFNPEDLKVGAFRHGGVAGIMKSTERRDWLTRLLVRCFTEKSSDLDITAVYLSMDVERDLHSDFHNDKNAYSYSLPIMTPRRGGGLWLELSQGDKVNGQVSMKNDHKGRPKCGVVHELQRGQLFRLNPHKMHMVEPWVGRRLVLIACKPALSEKLSRHDRNVLPRHAFPSCGSDSEVDEEESGLVREEEPELLKAGGWAEQLGPQFGNVRFEVDWRITGMTRPSMRTLEVEGPICMDPTWKHTIIQTPKEEGRCTRGENLCDPEVMVDPDDGTLAAESDVFLPVNGESLQVGMVQLFPPDLHVHEEAGPTLNKAEAGFTRDIEEVVRNLTEPLKVVHNVSPEEALANFEKWVPAIEKGLGPIDHAVRKISGKEPGVNTWLSNGAFQRLPTKLVFTVKPGDAPDPLDPRTWYKRKARLVVCGNMAAESDKLTFSPTAAAELVRVALVMSSQNKWQVGLLDVVAAFLCTPLQGPNSPRIAVQPPRVLQRAGMIPWGELWILTHALYGLRESPRLWSEYRDSLLMELKIMVDDEEMYLTKGKVEGSWWTVRDSQQRVHGIVAVYVDDVLVCSSLPVLRATAKAISSLWKTTDLAIITPGFPQRFLILGNGGRSDS